MSMVAGPLLAAGFVSTALTTWAGLLAALFTALTAGLLVWDLKRPDRFLKVLTMPNPRSWLVLGTWILIAYGVVGALWLLAGLLGARGLLSVLTWPGVRRCAFFIMLTPATTTRSFFGYTYCTAPVLPLSSPLNTLTVSPFLILFIIQVVR